MSKVIPVARKFLGKHPKAGQPTYFVEQILNTLGYSYWDESYLDLLCEMNKKHLDNGKLSFEGLENFQSSLLRIMLEKPHTIRAGNRWEEGDMASLRVWSDIPYYSPQIIFAPDVKVKTWGITIYPTNEIDVNKKFYCSFGSEKHYDLAANDGLHLIRDFSSWFNKLPFEGQIICWSDKVCY